MIDLFWPLVLLAGIVAILLVLAFRFPQGKGDWPWDGKTTAYAIFSAVTFLAILLLAYLATRDWLWPAASESLALLVLVLFALMLVGSFFAPEGFSQR